jgi:DNA-binding winged helix-turn-helix (wHTH) protein/tetratricopeptide (TPR) repeat protein
MLKLSDLAARGDFDAGPLHVSPARRLVDGPAGSTSVEPIVMKVFLLLLDAAGNVVTRDELFGNAWGGVFVGDDSLNRAIARVRKIASQTAPGSFEIENIPRTGYRLTGPLVAQLEARPESKEAASGLPRRTLVGIGAASAAVLAGGGWWFAKHNAEGRRFDDLVIRGREGLEYGEGAAEPIGYLREAVALRPADATAQGLYAYALVANTDGNSKGEHGIQVQGALDAAERALRVNEKEPNARLALVLLQRSTLDLARMEDRLRSVLKIDPNNVFVMRTLWNLLQSAGRSRDALAIVERAIAVKPLAAINNYPLAQFLWITGRIAEADRIIDRAMQNWPKHRFVRFARFTIFAFTGRPRAALAMLNDPNTRPQVFTARAVALWRLSLAALDKGGAADIARVRAAYLDAVKEDLALAYQAVMSLLALGELDAAFEIANNLLLFREPGGAPGSRGSTGWRFTPWLFVPPTAAMRADPRFSQLCDGIGLTEYWRLRGVRPDYLLAN